MRRSAVAFVLVAFVSGCASLPKGFDKPVSTTIPLAADTVWGRLALAATVGRNLSGVRLLSSGDEAFAALLRLADHAERSIDIQQYIIEQDDTSRAVLRHVRAAAARGVRVRILIDDLNTAGKDRRLLQLAEQPNMQVRVFNPFPAGRLNMWTRFVFSASEIPRINHRMHNKLFVVDGALAITGGRNIGDQYFARGKDSNYFDLDVIVAGPVVSQLASTFDDFWNSKFAYPIASLVAPETDGGAGQSSEDPVVADESDFLKQDMLAGKLGLTWAPAAVLADAPAKIAGETNPDNVEPVAQSMADLMGTASEEVTVISPYFVPGKPGLELMRNLIGRGVRVRVLTNSLATTDSGLVHIGYSRYRRDLLRAGVRLYELRPEFGQKKQRFHPFKSGRASLHAKSIVIDRKSVFIGSMNMDARSARTNSELGIVIRSVDIAQQVEALFDDVVSDSSYGLRLSPDQQRIEWTYDEGGAAARIWRRDPDTSWSLRLGLMLLAPLAVDGLL